MARIVVELTNRCNLRCLHCYDEQHAATGDLPLEIIDRVLQDGKACGIDHLSFTGGEPTMHRQFEEVVRRVCETDYTWSVVSNGGTFAQVYPVFLQYRQWLHGVTFSLDGACEATHDAQRGAGSYRRVMRAASICVVRHIPFTFNMVITAQNQHEVEAMIDFATRLGCHGVRFAHLMMTPDTSHHGLDLSPEARREVEAVIWARQAQASIPVGMGPGHYSESPFFNCAPLEVEEFNLDYRGNITLCCQLSGYTGVNADADQIGNLHEVSLATACERFRQRVATYHADKRARVQAGEFGELDHFPCWYCVKYLGKIEPLILLPQHPWMRAHTLEDR